MPVATVPVPRTVKARSTGMRNMSSDARAGTRRAARCNAARSSSIPLPFSAETAITAASPSELPRQRGAHVVAHEREPLLVDEIGLRERDDAGMDAEQTEDGEMLARLRHDAFVGRDDEQREVDPRRAGDHRAHERLVAGHVDDADRPDVHRAASGAKPRSIVMPRRFSSGSRSVSTPVRARTSAVLP